VNDEQAIRQTVADYYESWFDGDAPRMERALHPALAKRAPLEDGGLDEDTAATMIRFTSEGLGKARAPGPEGIGLEVEVVEIYGSIASAVAHSNVYREYLHLVRTNGDWRIVNVLYDRER
jgi:putative lumazine-binding protein